MVSTSVAVAHLTCSKQPVLAGPYRYSRASIRSRHALYDGDASADR